MIAIVANGSKPLTVQAALRVFLLRCGVLKVSCFASRTEVDAIARHRWDRKSKTLPVMTLIQLIHTDLKKLLTADLRGSEERKKADSSLRFGMTTQTEQ